MAATIKAEVLTILIEAEGFISWQELCCKFDKSVVEEAVRQLREDGYEIEDTSDKGCRLVGISDRLDDDVLKSIRKTQWAGQELFYFRLLDSTNAKAKQLAKEGYPTGTLVVAEQQEAGRGRHGRIWKSPMGSGVFMTLLLKPEIHLCNAPMLTLVAALAVARALEAQTGRTVGIKWPNDIVMNGKKVCGILTEMDVQLGYVSYIIVGIGINVHNAFFPEELVDRATSLYLETGMHLNRAALIEEILEQFEVYYAIYLRTEDLSGILNEYHSHLVNLHREVRVLDPKGYFEGQAMGITPQGELMVDTSIGRRLVSAGEVSVRGIYGYV